MTETNEVAELRAEVAELRRLVDQLTSGNADLTVRRLAVSDGLGDRITLEAEALGLARIEVALSPDSSTSATMFAYPGAEAPDLGFMIWTEGNRCASLTALETTDDNRGPAAPDVTGWWGELAIDHVPDGLEGDHLSITHEGVRQPRRGI